MAHVGVLAALASQEAVKYRVDGDEEFFRPAAHHRGVFAYEELREPTQRRRADAVRGAGYGLTRS